MPTTYTIPYILVQVTYANERVSYFAESTQFYSGLWENSDDAINELRKNFKHYTNRSFLKTEKILNVDNPDWMNDTMREHVRYYYRQTVVEILPRKTFTITR